MTRSLWAAAAGLFAALAGCSGGGPKFAPVSGVVLLDEKPYPNAVVSFQPIGTSDNPNPGRGSSAYTDANGRFELRGADGEAGAVVGKHRVRIMTKGGDVVGQNADTGSPDESTPAKGKVDPIPPEWNAQSTKEVEIPAGGTDELKFEIKSRKK